MDDQLSFRAFLAEQTKIGRVEGQPRPDQIDRLDQAIRRLAVLDPLSQVPELRDYAKGRPQVTNA